MPPAVIQKREDIVKCQLELFFSSTHANTPTAIKEVIAKIEKDFQVEISQKQEQVSTTLNQLREVTIKLGRERDKMNHLRQRNREHSELRQHCINLRRAIEEESARTAAPDGAADLDTAPDAPYFLKASLLAPVTQIDNLTPQQLEYVRTLPPARELAARLRAYRVNDAALRDKAARLHDRSSDLEEKFRRVVALCTGVDEDKVDSLLEGLVQAVESDPGEVDTARVSSFLRKVDESVGGE